MKIKKDKGMKGMMIKVACIALMVMVSSSFILSASGQTEQAIDPEGLELNNPGKLSVATEGTYPPFSMVDEKGNLYGLEIGVVKEICKRLGLEYVPVLMKWESLLVGLFSAQYDMISAAMDITPERQEKVLFSDGWLESGGRLIVRKDSTIKEIEDIKGKVVGALVASTWSEVAEKLGAANVKYYKAESDAIQDLVNRNIDGVVTDAVCGAYDIEKANMPLEIVPGFLTHIQKGFVFDKNRPNLVKAVNKALEEMVADGTYAQITKAIIGFDPYPKEPIISIFD